MAYTPSRYNDADLLTKAERSPSTTVDPTVKYGQQALNDLGSTDDRGRPLVVDGQFGNRTKASLLKFQEACGIARTGIFDHLTWYHLDWRNYGGWTHHPAKTSNLIPYGPAIVSVEGWAYNEILRPLTPVNAKGMTREGQRLSDVREAFCRRALGHEGAVRRNQVGSTGNDSRHWAGLADDDMGDQDKDRVVELDEILLARAWWDLMLFRAQLGPGYEEYHLHRRIPGETVDRVDTTGCRGLDRLSVAVLGNREVDGRRIFPDRTVNRDVSWSARRNTPKTLTGTAHVWPFHAHFDCRPGAPAGSPF